MVLTNTPTGWDKDSSAESEWTEGAGLRRGALFGGLTAGLLFAALLPLALWLPMLIFPIYLRAPLAFGVTWLLLRVVAHTAGMFGAACIAMGLAYSALVLFGQHLIFAAVGIANLAPVADEWYAFPLGLVVSHLREEGHKLIGAGWLHPYVLVAVTLFPWGVGGVLAAYVHSRE